MCFLRFDCRLEVYQWVLGFVVEDEILFRGLFYRFFGWMGIQVKRGEVLLLDDWGIPYG